MSVTYVRLAGDGTPDNPLSVAIGAEFDNYADELADELDADIDAAAQAAEAALRRASPYRRGSGRGHYRSGWRHDHVVDQWHHVARVYNINKPTLTHLLERGHDVVRGGRSGRGGRVVGHAGAIPHIMSAYQAAIDYLQSRGW